MPNANYSVSALPGRKFSGTNYNEFWITNRTVNGFTLNIEYASVSSIPTTFYWTAISYQ
jgi:hypothetical protein